MLLQNLALDGEGAAGKVGIVRLDQKGVETAAMLDRAQRRRGDAETKLALQDVRDQRDVAEVRQEPRPRLMVRMADQIAGRYADKLSYKREKGFNFWLFLKSSPMLIYNYILLTLMIFGTYLPARASQWWFFKTTILLKAYLKFFGKKPVSI